MEVWKIIFLSKWVICRFHVNLSGCKWYTHDILHFHWKIPCQSFTQKRSPPGEHPKELTTVVVPPFQWGNEVSKHLGYHQSTGVFMSLLKHLTKGGSPTARTNEKPFIKSHHNFFLSNRSPAALAKVLLSLIRAKATGSNCRANLSNCFCKPFATKPIPRGHVKDRELALQGPRSHHLQQVLCAARCCHL